MGAGRGDRTAGRAPRPAGTWCGSCRVGHGAAPPLGLSRIPVLSRGRSRSRPGSPSRCLAPRPGQSLSRAGPAGSPKYSQGGAVAPGAGPEPALGVGGRCGRGLSPTCPAGGSGNQKQPWRPASLACTWCLGRAGAVPGGQDCGPGFESCPGRCFSSVCGGASWPWSPLSRGGGHVRPRTAVRVPGWAVSVVSVTPQHPPGGDRASVGVIPRPPSHQLPLFRKNPRWGAPSRGRRFPLGCATLGESLPLGEPGVPHWGRGAPTSQERWEVPGRPQGDRSTEAEADRAPSPHFPCAGSGLGALQGLESTPADGRLEL